MKRVFRNKSIPAYLETKGYSSTDIDNMCTTLVNKAKDMWYKAPAEEFVLKNYGAMYLSVRLYVDDMGITPVAEWRYMGQSYNDAANYIDIIYNLSFASAIDHTYSYINPEIMSLPVTTSNLRQILADYPIDANIMCASDAGFESILHEVCMIFKSFECNAAV